MQSLVPKTNALSIRPQGQAAAPAPVGFANDAQAESQRRATSRGLVPRGRRSEAGGPDDSPAAAVSPPRQFGRAV